MADANARPIGVDHDGNAIWTDGISTWNSGEPPTPEEHHEIGIAILNEARDRVQSSDPIDPLVTQYARASATAVARAPRPIVFISVSGGVAEDALYTPDGGFYPPDEAPVYVIVVDWDNVESEVGQDPETQYAINYVKDLLEDDEVPQNIKDDLRASLERALRWETDTERAPYAHE